jgi:predicted metal-dependent phosphoesterase TrpH
MIEIHMTPSSLNSNAACFYIYTYQLYPCFRSTCSDGKFPPADVVAKAVANGVVYMSLTDHDTMAGVADATKAARAAGIFNIPGVEISAEAKGSENLHILGYFCPGTENSALEEKLLAIRQGRYRRGQEMLRKLVHRGF